MTFIFNKAYPIHQQSNRTSFKRLARVWALSILLIGSLIPVYGQTYFDMSTGNYTESFTAWSSPSTNSWSSVSANTGSIPAATAMTVTSTSFTTGTSGGIQNGNTFIQFLSTGATDNTSAVALDLNLNFTGRNAGNLSFDAATVANSTGNRAGSLRVYYALNGTVWTELTGTNLPFLTNNNVVKTGSINISLPNALSNQATVKLRFYYHNGGTALPTPTGSRPKILIDNVSVTALSSSPSVTVSPLNIPNLNYFTGNGPSIAGNYTVVGSDLTGDVTLNATTNFEISKTSNTTGFGSTLTLTPNMGILNSPIYVRLISGLSPNTYTGNITHTGGGISNTPTVNLTGNVTNVILPTKLKITAISPVSPLINSSFSITVQAQDNSSMAQNVAVATTFNLTLNTGNGLLGGTMTGIIPAGANSVVVTGLTYNVEENGVSVTATRTTGDVLTAGNSNNFNVVDLTPSAIIRSVASGNWNSTSTWNCNCVPMLSDTVRIRNLHTITVTTAAVEQGCAKILVDIGGTLNIQTVNFKMGFPVVQSSSIHLTMGNPSGAAVNVATPDNYLLDKAQYAISYNRSRGTSNWVSWYLSSAWIGSAPRQNDFRPDGSLPVGWYQVTQTDYTSSGFDRGHMTPSGDRTSTIADNSATFFMTNMIPQAPDNNQGPWEQLESYLRGQLTANGGQEIYIISGSYGVGGTGSNGGVTTTIAGGNVTVPAQTYKIAVILPIGTDDVNRVTTSTRVIAIIMPNVQGIRTNDWRIYRTSVDAIETATGYNYLSNLPIAIQDVVEATVDTVAN
jgi:endonuclease G, mitochondrial